jgi:hypothetical protein
MGIMKKCKISYKVMAETYVNWSVLEVRSPVGIGPLKLLFCTDLPYKFLTIESLELRENIYILY